jgi:type II secretory pathway pseudopilin PulG
MKAMKKTMKAMIGVTLLEIMLVLAIAAMIIVMSIRYYQSATTSQQANAVLEQIQAIAAAADSLAQSTGSYADANISNTVIQPLLPKNGLQTPWGTAITVAQTSATTYTVKVGTMPQGICVLVSTRLQANAHYGNPPTSNCTAGGADITYTYTSTAS